jgi:hypothetical protein
MLRHARPYYFARDEKENVFSFPGGLLKQPVADFDALEGEKGKTPIIYKHVFGERPSDELPSDQALIALGEAMKRASLVKAGREMAGSTPAESDIPAGYTYLGQFIFHDITALLPGKKAISGGHWKSARTPALDLDSVLDGVKPADDPEVAKAPDGLFEIGWTTGNVQELDDLRRIPEADEDAPDRGRPLISDSRNDDFLPLAQCHLLLLKFYNAIARDRGYDGSQRNDGWWQETRGIWIRHFQSIVLHDYLPRIIDCNTYQDIVENGRRIVLPDARAKEHDWFPIEFAGAIGRFGHSMIRESYTPWNTRLPGAPFGVEQFMEFSYLNSGDCLERHQFGLPGIWRTNWFKLFDLRRNGETGVDFDPFTAAAIDTTLAPSLFKLPDRVLADEAARRCGAEDHGGEFNLASQTLLRGRELGLATAQQALTRAGEIIGRPIDQLSREELFPAEYELGPPHRELLAGATPLWYYILREAERFGRGKRLGPLGGRLVMETVHAAIAASAHSIFDDPYLDCASNGTFTMPDLILFSGEI